MAEPSTRGSQLLKTLFLRLGVLPVLLVLAILIFAVTADQFLTPQNLINMLRQSVYLILVSLGQMLALVTGGLDLSVGTILAITSVVGATVMSALYAAHPDAAWMAVGVGSAAGLLAGTAVGLVNGVGIAFIGVSPFIMTLGVQSVGFGVALYMTGGVPVSGLPSEFGEVLGFGRVLGMPTPVLAVSVCVALFYVLMNRTALGNYFLAVGGNPKAAALSGVNVRRTLLWAYLLCALVTSVSGVLLSARLESGESNIGGTVALESIAASIIAGVSLRGGIGRVENVVLGAIFIVLVQNGMNVAGVGSYLQMVVLGFLLIIAVVSDQLRHRMLAGD
jgi:ribose transport system permease protein